MLRVQTDRYTPQTLRLITSRGSPGKKHSAGKKNIGFFHKSIIHGALTNFLVVSRTAGNAMTFQPKQYAVAFVAEGKKNKYCCFVTIFVKVCTLNFC